MTEYDDDLRSAKALELWGYDFQFDMVVEELSELIVAVQHMKRRPNVSTVRHVATEIADVEIMLKQLIYIMEYSEYFSQKTAGVFIEFLEDMRSFKRYRLNDRIETAIAENEVKQDDKRL